MKTSLLLVPFVALVLVGCHAGPAEQAATISPSMVQPSAKTTIDFLDEMRKKSGGDPSKLTPDELAKVNGITHGMAKIALKPLPASSN